METVVKKWGNSLAVRLPQKLAADLDINEGATVSLTVEDHALIVKPARKRYRLSELLAEMKSGHKRGETEWGVPAGKEIW